MDEIFYSQLDIWFSVNCNARGTICKKLYLLFLLLPSDNPHRQKKKKKISDWLLPLDVDISQRVKGKKPHNFHCRPLSKSGTSVYLLIVSIRAERIHNYMMGKTHAHKHAISLYSDQKLSCLSSTIKPSANVLPLPWMIITLSCNVLLMSHRNHASPVPGVSLL